ncbi:MAG: DinB family protein [Calditrichaeota bacterium]|nr:DinB family protein [Calditrichota bacterium]
MPGPFPVPEADDASTYFQTYIRLLGGENPLEADARIHAHTLSMLEPLSEEQSQFRYAPDKWSIREWLGHVIDCERVFNFRALWIARGAEGELPGFDQDAWVQIGRWHERSFRDSLDIYRDTRRTTRAWYLGRTPEELQRRGRANNNTLTVNSLLHILIGHELHHQRVLEARYMPALESTR